MPSGGQTGCLGTVAVAAEDTWAAGSRASCHSPAAAGGDALCRAGRCAAGAGADVAAVPGPAACRRPGWKDPGRHSAYARKRRPFVLGSAEKAGQSARGKSPGKVPDGRLRAS